MLHYKKNTLLCFFISFLLLGVSTTIVNADHTYKTSIVKKVLPAVVEVHAERSNIVSEPMQPQNRGGFQFRQPPSDPRNVPPGMPGGKQDPQHLGSGFVISSDGYILTNAHVVNNIFDGNGIVRIIFHDDNSYEAKLINYDEQSDIALLKITNAEFGKVFDYVTWGETPELGDDVIAIGSPMGQSFTVTFGNVSSLNRFIPNAPPFVPFIQTDAAINPGNSGGPLFNSSGELVGINTMIITDGGGKGSVGIGFAIDGDYAQKTVNQLYSGKQIERPYMGIMFRPVKKEDMKNYVYGYGAYVEEIVPDSPAAGILKVGDIILYMDNERVKWRLLATRVKSKTIGEEAHFIIIRDGMEVPLTFVMGAMQE